MVRCLDVCTGDLTLFLTLCLFRFVLYTELFTQVLQNPPHPSQSRPFFSSLNGVESIRILFMFLLRRRQSLSKIADTFTQERGVPALRLKWTPYCPPTRVSSECVVRPQVRRQKAAAAESSLVPRDPLSGP